MRLAQLLDTGALVLASCCTTSFAFIHGSVKLRLHTPLANHESFYQIRHSSSCLQEKMSNDSEGTSRSEIVLTKASPLRLASFAMIGLPFLSATFPLLLEWARSLPPNSPEQLQVVTTLFVSNRIYLYANAATIVALSAVRGSADSPKLGQRITDLTEELLYRPSLESKVTGENEKEKGISERESSITRKKIDQEPKPQLIQSLSSSGVQETLDSISADRQALILPVLVSALLGVSVFMVPLLGSPVGESSSIGPTQAQVLLQSIFPYLNQIWNAGLLILFTRGELRRLQSELLPGANYGVTMPTVSFVEWGLAAAITGVACLTPLWPAQNFVNMALAISVSRAIQLDRFAAIVGALSLLTLYDATSVFLIPAATAYDTSITLNAGVTHFLAENSVGNSAMGSLALQKLTSSTFQPGMLVSRVDSRFLGGSLGLGDAVFPSLLASFALRFDMDMSTSRDGSKEKPSFFFVAMVGYFLGCAACDVVPAVVASGGLPALVFIIPSMLGSVFVASTLSGESIALWNYQSSAESE